MTQVIHCLSRADLMKLVGNPFCGGCGFHTFYVQGCKKCEESLRLQRDSRSEKGGKNKKGGF